MCIIPPSPALRSLRLTLLAVIVPVAAAAVASLPLLPQDPGYHAFADDLTRFGLPNAANVLSNAAFIAAGFWVLGCWQVTRMTENVNSVAGLLAIYFLCLHHRRVSCYHN